MPRSYLSKRQFYTLQNLIRLKGEVSAFLNTAIGKSKPRSIISSSAFSLLSLFYIYSAAAFLNTLIFPLINRVTYYSRFDLYLIGESTDYLIIVSLFVLWSGLSIKKIGPRILAVAIPSLMLLFSNILNLSLSSYLVLLSMPIILVIILFDKIFKERILSWEPRLAVHYILVVSVVIGILGIVLQTSSFWFEGSDARNYLFEIFLVFSSFSPVLILLLIAHYPLKYLVEYVKNKLRIVSISIGKEELSLRSKFIFLSLSMALSVILVLIPHLPSVNTTGQNVGVDTGYYVTWVLALVNTGDLNSFIREAFVNQADGSRPLTLIIIYAIKFATDSDLVGIIEALPFVLAPLLTIVTYFLTNKLTSNEKIGIIASFMTAVSFQTLIGVYAGFYANWIAIIFGYLATFFMFELLHNTTRLKWLLFSILTFLLLFSHVYTWTVVILAMGIFLAYFWAKYNHKRRVITILLAIILSSVGVDFARVIFTGATGGIEGNIEIAETNTGPEQFLRRWNNLAYTATTYVGGIFSNFIILGLAIYWLFESRDSEAFSKFLPIFLALGILPFLFGDWVVQTRVYYDIPFQIPAAIGLYLIRNRLNNNLILYAILIWLIVIAIRTVSNFHLVLPQ